MKILYYPQISSVANGKAVLNTEATFNIMLTFIKCINEMHNTFEWVFLIPSKSEFNKEMPSNVTMIPIDMYLDSKIGRYDFNAQKVEAIIKEHKPDIIINNNPTLTRNIRILAPNTPIIQKNDFQGHGLPENINYRIRQVDGVISSDVAFEITQANKDLFIRYAANEFNSKIINILKKKIRVIKQGAYAKEINEWKKRFTVERFNVPWKIVFPGRIGTTNYNHWHDMLGAITTGQFDTREFQFIFTNPTKEKGKQILIERLQKQNISIIKENDHTDFTELVLEHGQSIYLFKYPDVREKYIELLCTSNVGVQLFDKNEEPHGGIACREMAWCNLKLILSDTFRVNGFVKKNYKYIVNMSSYTNTVKDLIKKIKAIVKEDGSLVYNVETMEEGAKILNDTIMELLNVKKTN